MRPEIGNIRSMYGYLETYAKEQGFDKMERSLLLMREKHAGQFRSGKEKVPYEVHSLSVCLHALLLGIEEEDVLCCCLLHDVAEDCGVNPADLPVSESVQEAVRLVSRPEEDHDACRRAYYEGIKNNRMTCIVKCLDRCSNLTGMFRAYSVQKMKTYAENTAEYLFPLLDTLASRYREERLACLLRYHIEGLLGGAGRIQRMTETK